MHPSSDGFTLTRLPFGPGSTFENILREWSISFNEGEVLRVAEGGCVVSFSVTIEACGGKRSESVRYGRGLLLHFKFAAEVVGIGV